MDTAGLHARLGDLFLSAIRLDGAPRAAFLDEVCGSDMALREQLEGMLRHHLTPAVDLDRPVADVHSLMALEEAMPARIGPYRLVRPIGCGGMAIVYLAEQSQPKREVAIKLIRPGCFSPGLVKRFEMEIETLGRLRHPAIAQILEAGTSRLPDGTPVPYFAMEYVPGKPLLEFAREAALDVSARVRLLQAICAGVQAAHRQGVIHRDLKPGNVLVTRDEETGRPKPKILDFGVARTTEPLGDSVFHTMAGQIVGTLPYMSPEQISGDPTAVDIRSDVYALGVIGFELLSDRSPYATTPRSYTEWITVIANEPARKLGALVGAARGDLEAVIDQALAKDPARRYQTAVEFADDLERVLRGEPIEARRDTMLTSMRRHATRYRWAIAASVGVAGALGLFAWHAWRQSEELRALAKAEQNARSVADDRADEAREARDLANSEAQRARAVTAYVLDTLGMVDPDVSRTADAGVRRMLDASAASADRLRDQPDVEAGVRALLGRAYYAYGAPAEARSQLMRAIKLARRDPRTSSRDLYAMLWPYRAATVELAETPLGDPETELAKLGGAILRERSGALAQALEALKSDANTSGDVRVSDEQFDTSLAALVRAADGALGAADDDRVVIGDQLVLTARRVSRRDDAVRAAPLLGAAVASYRSVLPDTNSRVARALNEWIAALIAAGDHVRAESLARDAIEVAARQLPPDHWYLAAQRLQLGAALAGQRRFDEAETLVGASLERLRETFGSADAYTVTALTQLCEIASATGNAETLAARRLELAAALASSMRPATTAYRPVFDENGRTAKAIEDFRRAIRRPRDATDLRNAVDEFLAARRAEFRDDDPRSALLADLCSYWGELIMNGRGDPRVADGLFVEAIRIDEASPIRHARKRAHPHWWIGVTAMRAGDPVTGERESRIALSLLEDGPKEPLSFTGVARSVVAASMCRQGKTAEGTEMLVDAYFDIVEYEGVGGGNALNAFEWLIDDLARRGETARIRELCERFLDVAELDRVEALPRRFGLLVAAYVRGPESTIERTLARFPSVTPGGSEPVRRKAINAVLAARLGKRAESAAMVPPPDDDPINLALGSLRAALVNDVAGSAALSAAARKAAAEKALDDLAFDTILREADERMRAGAR
jgi:tetratricopeptide (TPR) repeat protein